LKHSDEQQLVLAAENLSHELRELDLPLRFKRSLKPHPLEAIGGWWITLADWDGRPSVGVSIDRCLGFRGPKIWAGFWSTTRQKQKLIGLNERLPKKLHSRTTLTDKDFDQGSKWRLLKIISERSLKYPFVEHYREHDSYVGIYDLVGVGRT
jgi:hypothetical protein